MGKIGLGSRGSSSPYTLWNVWTWIFMNLNLILKFVGLGNSESLSASPITCLFLLCAGYPLTCWRLLAQQQGLRVHQWGVICSLHPPSALGFFPRIPPAPEAAFQRPLVIGLSSLTGLWRFSWNHWVVPKSAETCGSSLEADTNVSNSPRANIPSPFGHILYSISSSPPAWYWHCFLLKGRPLSLLILLQPLSLLPACS